MHCLLTEIPHLTVRVVDDTKHSHPALLEYRVQRAPSLIALTLTQLVPYLISILSSPLLQFRCTRTDVAVISRTLLPKSFSTFFFFNFVYSIDLWMKQIRNRESPNRNCGINWQSEKCKIIFARAINNTGVTKEFKKRGCTLEATYWERELPSSGSRATVLRRRSVVDRSGITGAGVCFSRQTTGRPRNNR